MRSIRNRVGVNAPRGFESLPLRQRVTQKVTHNKDRWLSLAEGARLEIVYTASNGIEGSNPSLSAK